MIINQEIYILGNKITDLSHDQVIKQIEYYLDNNIKGYVVTPNPEICLIGYNNKNYRRIINQALIAIPDGFGLKIGAFIFGEKLKNITTGVDLCWSILKLAEQNNYSILFFEGRPPIALRAKKVFNQFVPNLKINYLDPGQINLQGEVSQADLILQINQLKPDIILVNFGAPKQEYFIKQNIDKLSAKLMIGIGGSLDFISGRIKRAPQIWRKLHLEWLWRLRQEPWRWPRIIKAVIIFPLACLYWRFGNYFLYRNNVVALIINKNKEILIAKHAKTNEWKFPQGGAKNAKSVNELEQAIIREMKQELGTDKFKIIECLPNCYRYKFPKETKNIHIDHYCGQIQSLFLLEFAGQDNEITLDLNEHSDWQWVEQKNLMQNIAPSRKPLAQLALNKFKQYLEKYD